jgi:hypothetical protein
MGYFINRQNIVDNSRDLAPGKFTSRAGLPTGAAGYLAYISDQNDLVVGGPSLSQAPDTNITWYKFLVKPFDYKNDVILGQGVIVGGGLSGYGDRNTIQQLIFPTDTLIKLTNTMDFNTAYGGGHSTTLYGYYHQGRDSSDTQTPGYKSAKIDWATYTRTYLNNRTNCFGGGLNSTQPGLIVQNTFGVLLKGTNSCYITFSTDTWTAGGYNASATGTGWGSYGQDRGYNYAGSGSLYAINLTGGTWYDTGAGGPPNGGGAGKSLNSKYGKRYNGGARIDAYIESSNSWRVAANSPRGNNALLWQEQQTLMAQDWGYWIAFSDVSSGSASYSVNTYYHHFPTDTIVQMAYANASYPSVVGSTAVGP